MAERTSAVTLQPEGLNASSFPTAESSPSTDSSTVLLVKSTTGSRIERIGRMRVGSGRRRRPLAHQITPAPITLPDLRPLPPLVRTLLILQMYHKHWWPSWPYMNPRSRLWIRFGTGSNQDTILGSVALDLASTQTEVPARKQPLREHRPVVQSKYGCRIN